MSKCQRTNPAVWVRKIHFAHEETMIIDHRQSLFNSHRQSRWITVDLFSILYRQATRIKSPLLFLECKSFVCVGASPAKFPDPCLRLYRKCEIMAGIISKGFDHIRSMALRPPGHFRTAFQHWRDLATLTHSPILGVTSSAPVVFV